VNEIGFVEMWIFLVMILYGVAVFLLRKQIKAFYDSDAAIIGKILLFPYIAAAPIGFVIGVIILLLPLIG